MILQRCYSYFDQSADFCWLTLTAHNKRQCRTEFEICAIDCTAWRICGPLCRAERLSLFAYVGVVFTVKVDWHAAAVGALVSKLELSGGSLTLIVAMYGTTISPYLFFWQSSQEIEEVRADHQPVR